ncbi:MULTISPECIES: VOC family protein [unclassified Brenneria]|uniref:VOC family protein n=1 Tax=unclassified Brenneria TaxID=2634434 RepID=UPI0015582741|nr:MULTISPECIES: VOC family protein [unclassified Brenneria]MBJ7220357.1 VOC family protein [Brenneria sp. L3-3C-1]MEE3641602.1 VOC family protein [Brenneria sp. L3_3C_1]MEE3649767.1 VOC family protein [Brenneria sp. HEZEL_4_2_4]NPC99726.1 VOC family protein [Brenneria sp. hezel4-2-4]
MANLLWDHVVHYVNNPDDAVAAFNHHQLAAFPGGSHPGWGTHNALSYFGLTYIEFLAIRDAAELAAARDTFLLAHDAQTLLPQHQILYRLALRSDDIDASYAALQQHDLALSPIVDGKRHDAQGNLIEWRMFTIAGDYQGVAYPFIIQWGDADDARLRLLRQRGLDRPHPAGNITIQSALFKVKQPQQVAAHWQRLFNLPYSEQDPARLRIGDRQFIFQTGELNRLAAIRLQTDNPELKQLSLFVGDGEYQFI